MSAPSVSGVQVQPRHLLLAALMLTTTLCASVAAAIDLSRFNAVQVRIRTDFELTWVNTLYDGSQTTEAALADRLLISGVVDFDAGTVHVEPMFVLPDAEDIEPRVPGNYSVVLRSAALAELARYAFTPSESQEDPSSASGEPGNSLGFFSELVPYVDGTAVVDIDGPDGLLDRVSAGSRTPTVRVTAPNGGEQISADALDVSWAASDADGDPLVFNVQYSADDGASWEVVAQAVTQNHVTIDRINLAASTRARVRVCVSDGIHTAWDESDAAFEVANAPPTEIITGVNITLEMQTLGVCPVFDANRDGDVTIDEIIQGVNAALRGCPTPTPTVSPGIASLMRTRTPTPTGSGT